MLKEHHKATAEVLKKAAFQGAGPAGLFATTVGFFSDFVKPLINLVPYFLVASIAAALILWFKFIAKGKKADEVDTLDEILKSRHGILFGVTVLSSAFWLIMIPIFALTPQDGVVASVIPQASELQKMMMGRFDKIDAKLDQGFSAVLSKIDSIDKSAGIVSNPTSYNDYYHNAKVYELTGNLIEARKAYEKYFETNLIYFDPFLSYAQIIKAQEGPSSAEEFLGKLRDKYTDNPGAALIYAVNKSNKEDKEFLLEKLKAQFPDYGPIYLSILELNSYKEGGIPTLAEQEKAQNALKTLNLLEEKENFSKFFIDKTLLSQKQEFVKSQNSMMNSYYGAMVKNPIDFKYELVNGSVSMTFVPMEMVKKIFYRIDDKGEYIDTGSMGVKMPGSDQSLPNYGAIEKVEIGKHTVEVKYVDQKDQESPAKKFEMEVKPLQISYMGYKIQNPKTGQAGPYIYYNFLSSDDGSEVKYSIDSEKYDQSSDGMIFLDGVSNGAHTVYIKAKLASGKWYQDKIEINI